MSNDITTDPNGVAADLSLILDCTDIEHWITRDGDDLWIEFAIPTHDGRCPDCETQSTGPAFDLVERGLVRGSWGNGQCGGCGQLGKGWLHTGARSLPADPLDHDLFCVALRDEIDARRREWAAVATSEIRAALITDLRSVVETLRAAGLDPANVTSDDAAEHVDLASDTEPGVWVSTYPGWAGSVEAWAYHPEDPTFTITVTLDDLGSR